MRGKREGEDRKLSNFGREKKEKRGEKGAGAGASPEAL
jgi:hypothetical protein